MIRFRMVIDGEVQMDRGIARFADGVTDYRPVWPVIADEFYAEVAGQFESEGAQGGRKWAPLSPAYAKWKEARYPGRPILERTGDLKRSLTSEKDPNAVRVEQRKGLMLGSKIPYGVYHQSPRPRGRLPRRAPILLSARFKREAMRHMQAYLVEMATASGFRSGLPPTAASKLGRIFGKGIPPRRALGLSPRRSSDGTFALF